MKTKTKTTDRHSKDTVQLNAFIPVVLHGRLQHYADLDQRPLSGYVRFVLTKHIERLDSDAGQQPPITKTA